MASEISAQLNNVLTDHGLSADVSYIQDEATPFQCHLVIKIMDNTGKLITEMDDFAITKEGQMVLKAAYTQDNVHMNQ